MRNQSIDKIEKVVENILPISGAFIDELDYSVIEQKKQIGSNYQNSHIV